MNEESSSKTHRKTANLKLLGNPYVTQLIYRTQEVFHRTWSVLVKCGALEDRLKMMLVCSCSTLGESGSPSYPVRGWSSEMQIQWVYCLKLCVLQTFWLGFLLLHWKLCCWEIFLFFVFCCWFPLPLLSLPRNSLDTRVLPGALEGRGCWFDSDFFFFSN